MEKPFTENLFASTPGHVLCHTLWLFRRNLRSFKYNFAYRIIFVNHRLLLEQKTISIEKQRLHKTIINRLGESND